MFLCLLFDTSVNERFNEQRCVIDNSNTRSKPLLATLLTYAIIPIEKNIFKPRLVGPHGRGSSFNEKRQHN